MSIYFSDSAVLYNINTCLASKLWIGHLVYETFRDEEGVPKIYVFMGLWFKLVLKWAIYDF